MAIKLDAKLLRDLGYGALTAHQANVLIKAIYDTLEILVGARLAERMSFKQLDLFEEFIDANDEVGAQRWLEHNFPDYTTVVNDALKDISLDLREVSSQVRLTSGSLVDEEDQ